MHRVDKVDATPQLALASPAEKDCQLGQQK